MTKITLTEVERSYLIIELQKNIDDLIKKHDKAFAKRDKSAYCILEDARFVADLLTKISKGDDEQ